MVQIGGVLLVFSYLIVPAVGANFLADSLRARMLIGWITATLASIAGAAIVCALGLALLLIGSVATLVRCHD
jgi:ABC-type Mn2+/Zn2+ transport system permease subunit